MISQVFEIEKKKSCHGKKTGEEEKKKKREKKKVKDFQKKK